MKTALILVDIQNDFVPDGALAVPKGDDVVPVANRLMDYADLVVATQDWHPADHGSFVSQHPEKAIGDVVDLNGIDQIVWPDHCVQDTKGAQFVDTLDMAKIDHVMKKGTDKRIDSYSGFFDNNHQKDTGLEKLLKEKDVTHLILVGLATDYCVKFTAMDARSLEFEVTLVADGVRGVNLDKDDSDKAVEEMRNAGVMVKTAAEVMESKK